MSEERRKHQRIAASLRVKYKTIDALQHAYTNDISEGGLFLPTRKALPVGSLVTLFLELPNEGGEIKTFARVIHAVDETQARAEGKKPGMGLEFLKVQGAPIDEQVAKFLFNRNTASVPPRPKQRNRARILVVDDSDFHRQQATDAMTKAGYDVTTAKDGREALAIVARQMFDLVLSDVKMPNMDGWQLLRMIRSRSKIAATPFIFLTSMSNDKERLKGYKLGVDDYIGKGFSEQELLARVERVLERTKPQQLRKERALKGDLSHVSLPTLLSLLELEKRSGHLLVTSGAEMANLFLNDGIVANVDIGEEHQEKNRMERFFHVLGWTEGEFEFSTVAETPEGTPEDGLPISFVLLEWAKQQDEQGA